MDYVVTGIDKEGRPFTRTVAAASAQAATESVRAEGAQVSDLRATAAPAPPPARGRLTAAELIFFSSHLASVTRLGLPLPGALRSLAAESRRPAFRKRVEALAARIEGGSPLSAALAEDRLNFPTYYVHALEAGEKSGTLGPILALLADHLRLLLEIRRKTVEILVYPAVLLAALVGILGFYSTFAESIGRVYEGLGKSLPVVTSLVILAGSHGLLISGIAIGGFLCALALLKPLLRLRPVHRLLDRLGMRSPVIGTLLKTALVTRFCHLLPLLLDAGIPASQALDLVAEALGSATATAAVQEAAGTLREGGTMADGARGGSFLPATLVWMIGAGESRGELSVYLREAAALYETTFRHQIAVMENIFGPILVILTGIFVLSVATGALLAPLVDLLRGMG